MMDPVKNKVALITGGIGGIGYALAEEFLKNGLRAVVLVDYISNGAQEKVQKLVLTYGPKVQFIKADIRIEKDICNMFDEAIKLYQNLDIVVNCAGILESDDWENVLQINLIAPCKITKKAITEFLPRYRTDNESLIINVSSLAGIIPSPAPEIPFYSTSKAGLIQLSLCYGTDFYYKQYQTKVFAICLGMTNTGLLQSFFQQMKEKNVDTESFSQHMQTAEEVATMTMDVIRNGKNGSAWTMEGGKSSEVEFTDLYPNHLATYRMCRQ